MSENKYNEPSKSDTKPDPESNPTNPNPSLYNDQIVININCDESIKHQSEFS